MQSPQEEEEEESPNHGIGGYALCVSDGGIAACAFQAGAILALWDRGLLRDSRIVSASGSGISLVTMLLQATCTQKEQDPWSRYGLVRTDWSLASR